MNTLPQLHVALAQVPQILEQLGLPDAAISDILAERTNPAFEGKFVGDIAVSKGYVSAEQLEHGLAQQARLRASAAAVDMQTLTSGSRLVTPVNLNVHWGNNGQVNAPDPVITQARAASAAANVAELITLLTNQQPAMALQLQPGVVAAKHLTQALLNENSSIYPIERAGEWMKASQDALITAAAANNVSQETVNQYIANRYAGIPDVAQAIMQAQEQNGPQR